MFPMKPTDFGDSLTFRLVHLSGHGQKRAEEEKKKKMIAC